jgi:hypothetical protein
MASVVTNVGKGITARRVKGTGQAEPVHTHWGTGAGTAAATDTGLFTPASEARVAGTSSVVTTTNTDDTYQVVGTITADGAKTITNAGLFDAATAGNLFVKGDFAGVALALNDQIQFTFKVQWT